MIKSETDGDVCRLGGAGEEGENFASTATHTETSHAGQVLGQVAQF